MIPNNNDFLTLDFVVEEQTSRTYRMNIDKINVRGFSDEQEAMKQLIYKILNTERYQYVIYSWDFGVELLDLFGEPISYVVPEIKRRITEALTADSRITECMNFEFEVDKNKVHTLFTAVTVFGNIPIEKVVNF